jgi:hypothetical protein
VFHLLNRIYGRSVTPGRRRRPWGDLVVPTGWRQWGRSMVLGGMGIAILSTSRGIMTDREARLNRIGG